MAANDGPRYHLPISGSLGAVIAISFFLPWYRVQCLPEERTLMDPSGYHLATGRPDPEARAEARREVESLKSHPPPGVQPSGEASNESPTPELWAILAAGVALTLWGFARLFRPAPSLRRETVAALVLCSASLAFLAAERAVLYRREYLQELRRKDKEGREESARKGEPAKEEVKMEDRYGFYMTLGALGAVVIVQAAWLAQTRTRLSRRA